jgi:Fic family protein
VDEALLKNSHVGQLVPISGRDPRFGEDYNCWAFLPDPLPASIELSNAAWTAALNAAAALARADEAAGRLPNPSLVARPAIRREAVATSALEGTFAALTDVLEAEFTEERDIPASVREVRNYVVAAEHGVAAVRDRPISLGLIRDLQRTLVTGTASEGLNPGQVRSTQVFIGAGDSRVTHARFVPPPPGDQLQSGLDDWVRWMSESELPVVLRTALGHYQFETLHPFTDGNGRVGRLLATLQLIAAGDLRYPVVNLSPWFERHRRAYQETLFEVSRSGDFSQWARFFCTALADQAAEAVSTITQLNELKDRFASELRSHGVRSVALPIAEELIGFPILSVKDAATRHGVSFQTANAAVARLCEIGILRQLSRGRYDRLFACQAVVEVVQR